MGKTSFEIDEASGAHAPANTESAPEHESIWSAAFVILLATNFFQSTAAFMANTTIPLYLDSLGASAGIVGIVVGSFAVSALLIRPFAGPAFDSFSRKRLLMGAQAVIALAFVLYSVVTSVPMFLAVRLLHGVGIGCSGPLAMSLVSEYLPVKKFATGISVYTLAQTIAQVIGPSLGLWLIDALGYGPTYFLCGMLLLVSMISISRLRELPRTRLPYRLQLSRMFAREAVDKALVAMLFSISFGGITSYLVLYATKLGIDNIGLYFVVYACCLFATRPLYGRLADTFGAQRVLIPGVICFGASYALLTGVTDLIGLLGVAAVAALGFGACMPLVQSLGMSCVPIERRGAASNTVYTGLDLGSLLGPLLAGQVIELLQPALDGNLLAAYGAMWWVMMIPQALALVVILSWNIKQASPGARRL